jgi:Spy/CpxP family protein refolding chaperone
MRVVSMVLAVAVSLMMIGKVSAADDQKGPEGTRPHRPMIGQWDMLKGLDLTADQKAKLEELKKEYGPKFKEARQKADSILTEDQKKARSEARKAAQAAGKKGPEVWKDAQAAMKLTDEQKAKLAEARKTGAALGKEVHEKVMALLTPEQKEQLKKAREGMRARGPGRGAMGRGAGMLRGLNLTDDQKAKVKEIMKQYGPQLKEAREKSQALHKEVHEKVLALLTPEQQEQLKKERQDRRKAHSTEGK